MSCMKSTLLHLLFLVFLTACGKIKDPEFRRLESFEVKSFGIQNIEVGFKVIYHNPNNFTVSVKEAFGDFYIDSLYVGKITQDQMIEVGKNAEFSLPMSGSVPLASALKMKVDDLSNRQLLVQATGSVKVGKGGIFISRPFTYSGQHKLDIKL